MSKTTTPLYNQFKPENYNLTLSINKKELTFSGNIQITGQKIGRPCKRITFHQSGLQITSASITKQSKQGQETITPKRMLTHKSLQEIRIHTDQELYAGKYIVNLTFKGTITKDMLGIYPSYFKHNDRTETIIATQFESHYAREAFPCIDEPSAKATFDLTLITDKDDIVLSNTSIKTQSTNNQTTTTNFETTPKMSTYLLAFVTGAMHSVESKTKAGTLVRSWSCLSRPKKELQYSVDEAVKILDFFTNYFGIPYPLKKCDQVALPDFDAGAMENWGLITYREIALLSNPDNTSISNEQYVSLVIAHELSHQWFGNLVTMKWWDDLWLNESFASLMEHIALDAIHPDWHQWEFYVSSDVISTTSRDIYKDIQPVGVKVTDPDLIDTLFDPSIVYAKGGRLLKMLRDYIGDDVFREGLKIYFKKHAFANTTRDDLWSAMSEASGKNISLLMTPWIEQPGMPVLNVNQEKKQIKVSQQRFVLDSDNETSLWPIPILANQTLNKDLLTKQSETLISKTDESIIVNENGSGHYLTLYKSNHHKQFLAHAIATRSIPAETRINLLNDSLILARGGDASLVDSLSLISQCANEDRDSVWTLICRILGSASQLTEGDEQTDAYIKAMYRKLANNWYARLDWKDKSTDDPNTKQLRHTVISLMLTGEDKTAINKALAIFDTAKTDLHQIDAELRASIISATVRFGASTFVDDLIELYKSASPDLQIDITSGLTSTKNSKIASQIIFQALGKNGFVRSQDIMRWIALFLRNRHTRQAMWDFLVSDWDWLEKTLAKSKSFDYLPVYCGSVMNSSYWEKEYHKLFESKLSYKTLERNIRIGFSDVASRVAWRNRDEAKIIKFFKDQSENLLP